jgi:hypothetical protein
MCSELYRAGKQTVMYRAAWDWCQLKLLVVKLCLVDTSVFTETYFNSDKFLGKFARTHTHTHTQNKGGNGYENWLSKKANNVKSIYDFQFSVWTVADARRQRWCQFQVSKSLCVTGRRHPSKYMPCRSQNTSVTVAAQTYRKSIHIPFYYYHVHWIVYVLDSLT